MPATVIGRLDWDLRRDREGHREYFIQWLVKTDFLDDGPLDVLSAPELPLVGSWWEYGRDNDPWAFCTPEATVKPVLAKEPGVWWIVENIFSTRPLKRCQDSTYEDPLSEPYRISGSFNPFSEEAFFDKDGNVLRSSSWEPFKGPAVEFDNSKPTVTIGWNMPDLPLAITAQLMHNVNDSFLWGLGPRCVKLSGMRFQRQLFGTCNYFYAVDYDFDINYNTFDRWIPDSGTKILKSGGDKDNPKDFIVYKEDQGENTRVFLNGQGVPANTLAEIFIYKVQKYKSSNLLLLGIPTTL
jgi:hypothetical protein